MNKRLYVDFHILQTVPPSCINRDDTGSPKRQCTAVCSAPGCPHRHGSMPCAQPLRRMLSWTWASALKRPQNW